MNDIDAVIAIAVKWANRWSIPVGLVGEMEKEMRQGPARNGTCPIAGYDQGGESHYCIDCSRHWYGDNLTCEDIHCPFRPAVR